MARARSSGTWTSVTWCGELPAEPDQLSDPEHSVPLWANARPKAFHDRLHPCMGQESREDLTICAPPYAAPRLPGRQWLQGLIVPDQGEGRVAGFLV